MFYLLLFVLSFSLTYVIRKIAIKKSIIAKVSERSSHSIPTPQGGGVAIAVTWFLGLFYLKYNLLIDDVLFYSLLPGFLISLISFFDDIYELSPKARLIVQAFSAAMGLYFLNGFCELNLFNFSINNSIVLNILAFLMIIWFINLYNFLDGLDGYATSEIICLSLAGYFLFGESVFLILIASSFGFLLWNWDKAKIFMGDVGSTLLGYNIAIFTIYYSNLESLNFWIWIILFMPFWFDATVTLLRRYLNKEKISQAHKKHIYQRLNQSGLSHACLSVGLIFLNIIMFSLVYFLNNLVLEFFLAFVIMCIVLKITDTRKAFK